MRLPSFIQAHSLA